MKNLSKLFFFFILLSMLLNCETPKEESKELIGREKEATARKKDRTSEYPSFRIKTDNLISLLGDDYEGLIIEFTPVPIPSPKNKLRFHKVYLDTLPEEDTLRAIILDTSPLEHIPPAGYTDAEVLLEFEEDKDSFELAYLTKSQLAPIFRNEPRYLEIRGTMIDFGEEGASEDLTGPTGVYFTFLMIAKDLNYEYDPSPSGDSLAIGRVPPTISLPVFQVASPCPPDWQNNIDGGEDGSGERKGLLTTLKEAIRVGTKASSKDNNTQD